MLSNSHDIIKFEDTKITCNTPLRKLTQNPCTSRSNKFSSVKQQQTSVVKNQKKQNFEHQRSTEKSSDKKVHFSDDNFGITYCVPHTPNQIPAHNPILNPELLTGFFPTSSPMISFPEEIQRNEEEVNSPERVNIQVEPELHCDILQDIERAPEWKPRETKK